VLHQSQLKFQFNLHNLQLVTVPQEQSLNVVHHQLTDQLLAELHTTCHAKQDVNQLEFNLHHAIAMLKQLQNVELTQHSLQLLAEQQPLNNVNKDVLLQ
jgi:hypothetical protein